MPMMVDKPVTWSSGTFVNNAKYVQKITPWVSTQNKNAPKGAFSVGRSLPIIAKDNRTSWGLPVACARFYTLWNFDSTLFHNLTRELNQRYKWFRTPAT